MWKEFREFISRGNVIDLAVAVIIGAAFTAVVTALVDNILMPIIGILLGGVDFSGLAVTVGEATIGYGQFIQAVIDFLIIAFVIFMLVRFITRLRERRAGAAEKPVVEAPEEVRLLRDIRDLLKTQRS